MLALKIISTVLVFIHAAIMILCGCLTNTKSDDFDKKAINFYCWLKVICSIFILGTIWVI